MPIKAVPIGLASPKKKAKARAKKQPEKVEPLEEKEEPLEEKEPKEEKEEPKEVKEEPKEEMKEEIPKPEKPKKVPRAKKAPKILEPKTQCGICNKGVSQDALLRSHHCAQTDLEKKKKQHNLKKSPSPHLSSVT